MVCTGVGLSLASGAMSRFRALSSQRLAVDTLGLPVPLLLNIALGLLLDPKRVKDSERGYLLHPCLG